VLISDVSLKRPIFATVIMLALMVLGLFSYRRLAVDQFPNVEIPVVSIITKYPGASPETVEREVTKRIEEAVNPIAGVKHVSSSSLENVSIIYVEFNLETKVNEVIQDARAKVSAIRGELPDDIEEPILDKLDFQALPVASLSVQSKTMSPVALSTFVEKKIKPRLETISGVGKVNLVGLAKREVNVVLDRTRMESLGMGVDEVIGGLQSENVNAPLGSLKRGNAEFPLRISGKPEDVAGFESMVIASRSGRPVTLGEIATIVDGMEEPDSLAMVNGVPAIGIDILKQSGSNTVALVDTIKKITEKLGKDLPEGVEVKLVRDGSQFIRDSVSEVEHTMVLGGILTVFIVFCFLSSWRSTIITGITLPISVISSFSVMYFMGMTLNIMTLMALSLAIGLLIDDAIVVRENIVRHLERGQDHFTAASEGSVAARSAPSPNSNRPTRSDLPAFAQRTNACFTKTPVTFCLESFAAYSVLPSPSWPAGSGSVASSGTPMSTGTAASSRHCQRPVARAAATRARACAYEYSPAEPASNQSHDSARTRSDAESVTGAEGAGCAKTGAAQAAAARMPSRRHRIVRSIRKDR